MSQPPLTSQPEPSPVTKTLSAQDRHERLTQLRSLTRLLDNAIAIPGTTYRVGIDPLLGLFPGLGDMAGMLMSAYIVMQAATWKLPSHTLGRMVMNLGMDWLAGTVPLVGDMFDVVWKANSENLKLLEAHLESPEESRAADRWFVFGIFVVLGLLVALAGLAGGTLLWVVMQLWHWVSGG
jgi:hypothetical protein